MSIYREDVGSECNTERRKFWELCASSYEPTLDFESSCKRASEWADEMLIEWDKRWIVEAVDDDDIVQANEVLP